MIVRLESLNMIDGIEIPKTLLVQNQYTYTFTRKVKALRDGVSRGLALHYKCLEDKTYYCQYVGENTERHGELLYYLSDNPSGWNGGVSREQLNKMPKNNPQKRFHFMEYDGWELHDC